MVKDDANFVAPFKVTVQRDGPCHGFVLSFITDFTHGCDNEVALDTTPTETPTHWKQTMLLLKDPREFKSGDVVKGSLDVRANKINTRQLIVTLTLPTEAEEAGAATVSYVYNVR